MSADGNLFGPAHNACDPTPPGISSSNNSLAGAALAGLPSRHRSSNGHSKRPVAAASATAAPEILAPPCSLLRSCPSAAQKPPCSACGQRCCRHRRPAAERPKISLRWRLSCFLRPPSQPPTFPCACPSPQRPRQRFSRRSLRNKEAPSRLLEMLRQVSGISMVSLFKLIDRN